MLGLTNPNAPLKGAKRSLLFLENRETKLRRCLTVTVIILILPSTRTLNAVLTSEHDIIVRPLRTRQLLAIGHVNISGNGTKATSPVFKRAE